MAPEQEDKEDVMRMAWLVSAMLVAPAIAACAAESEDLSVGMLVRVTISQQKLKGLVLATDPEALTLVVEGQHTPIRLVRADIRRIEVGTRRSPWAGAARGAGRGLLIGGAAGLLIGSIPSDADSRTFGMVASGTVTGFWSALIGGIIGAAKPGEGWKPLPGERVRVGVAPQRGRGVGVAMSVSF
jgi:hypothetical protein